MALLLANATSAQLLQEKSSKLEIALAAAAPATTLTLEIKFVKELRRPMITHVILVPTTISQASLCHLHVKHACLVSYNLLS